MSAAIKKVIRSRKRMVTVKEWECEGDEHERGGKKRGWPMDCERDRARRREEGKGEADRECWHSAVCCYLIRC